MLEHSNSYPRSETTGSPAGRPPDWREFIKNGTPADIAAAGLGYAAGFALDVFHFHVSAGLAPPLMFASAGAVAGLGIKKWAESLSLIPSRVRSKQEPDPASGAQALLHSIETIESTIKHSSDLKDIYRELAMVKMKIAVITSGVYSPKMAEERLCQAAEELEVCLSKATSPRSE